MILLRNIENIVVEVDNIFKYINAHIILFLYYLSLPLSL